MRGRQLTRIGLLELETEIVDGDRRFKINKNLSKLDDPTRCRLEEAFQGY